MSQQERRRAAIQDCFHRRYLLEDSQVEVRRMLAEWDLNPDQRRRAEFLIEQNHRDLCTVAVDYAGLVRQP